MDIIIQNVTGTPGNEWLIWEITKATGLREGDKVYNANYEPENNSCRFTIGTTDCIAWLGETCVEFKSGEI